LAATDSPLPKIDSGTFGALLARPIGPAITSGRISAIDGVGSNPMVLYVGAAGGGVWKTVNGGTTFKPVFEKNNQSIGAIAVDQAHPDTVWVGTGEVWVRNSVSVGSGIYKSTDAGDNWQFMGLPDSERIGRIVVDPKDSGTVYVAVLGHLWDSSENRGLYKTTDGGKTWKKILYVDANTGCADVAIDPQETSVLYASTWQFRRYPWKFVSGGPGSGLHRSTDGGRTWQKVKDGMPEGELGRIAIAVAPSRPSTVYAVVESKKTALYRSDDLGRTWRGMSTAKSLGTRPFYFSLLVVDPKDYKRVYKPGMMLSVSKDGGETFTDNVGSTTHSDHHALWIDPSRSSTLYLGTDGGVYRSFDSGGTWSMLRNLPVAQFYHVTYDMQEPYNVYGGLQDNGSWMGPSQGRSGIQNRDWVNVGFGDGFNVFADPSDKNTVYSEWQGGKLLRYDRITNELKSISPRPKAGEPKYRFNWNAPAVLSPTDPKTIYLGAQFLFRSRDRGESWERISGDLTTNDPEKQKQEESGGLTIDNSSAENHCTLYAIAESPLNAKVIWVGTDDGNLQLTRDGGETWTNVTPSLVPKNTVVSGVEPSRFQAGTAYATFDGHQTGDMKAYVLRTDDFGKTWTSIGGEGIKGFAHVIREDRVKPGLLFVGTESGLFLTVDGGRQWAQFTGNLPNAAVRDIAIHPREHDLILATHGRGVYIVDDITPIRQITPEVLQSKLTVLENRPSPVRLAAGDQSFPGDDEFIGRNTPEVAFITYYMKERHTFGDFKIQVFDSSNQLIATLPAGTRRGINRVEWPMRLKPPKAPPAANIEFGSLSGPMVPEGTYTAKLVRGDESYTATIQLVGDPALPHSAAGRKLQQTTVMNLYRLIERLAFVDAQIVDARDQAEKRKLGAARAKFEELHKTLAATREGQITGEEKIREQLGELYGDVSRYGGRPTQSQIDRAKVLEAEVDAASKSFDAEMSKLPELKKLSKEEYDRRQKDR
jgi:photosystem II stability/assembly factor-like uncharacterized protein